MGNMRINHMELTFAEGSLTTELKDEIREFYKDLFGWEGLDIDVVGQQALLMMMDEVASQFILLAESPKPISSPGYDHLGLLFETREEVDQLLEKCKAKQKDDPRIEIKEYEDLDQGGTIVHAFYVRHLLPIWFDVQNIEFPEGFKPERQWRYE